MKIVTELTYHQTRVLQAFRKENTDYDIAELFYRVYSYTMYDENTGVRAYRIMQQKIAPTFKTINRKIKGGRIVPGKLKRTYRLDTKGN